MIKLTTFIVGTASLSILENIIVWVNLAICVVPRTSISSTAIIALIYKRRFSVRPLNFVIYTGTVKVRLVVRVLHKALQQKTKVHTISWDSVGHRNPINISRNLKWFAQRICNYQTHLLLQLGKRLLYCILLLECRSC